MFEYDGKQYELKMNRNRVDLVEQTTKKSIMGEWQNNNGLFSLNTCEACFMLCLKEVGSDVFCSQKVGRDVCNGYMEEHGYAMVANEIMEALQKDMPFLFLAS